MRNKTLAGTNQGVRPVVLLLLMSIIAGAGLLFWTSRSPVTSAKPTTREPAAQPLSERVKPETTVHRSVRPNPSSGIIGSEANPSTDPPASQSAAAAIGEPVLVTPEGTPSAEYTQRVARVMAQAAVRAEPPPERPTSLLVDPAALAVGGTPAGAPAPNAGLTSGSAPGSSVDGYRRSDQMRRALVEEMRKVRRAMLEEASRQKATAP